MHKAFQLSHLVAGFTAVLVGYTSSVVIVIQAAQSSGANEQQTASWLLALGVLMGLTTIIYSFYYKQPILTAWSTPGAVMIIGLTDHYSAPEYIGAFMVTGLLIFITGLVKPIDRILHNIDPKLATAMLAGILLPFCLKAFAPLGDTPILFAILFVAYLSGKIFAPKYTMLIMLFAAVASSLFFFPYTSQEIDLSFTQPMFVTPEFRFQSVINIALPLYIITMLSQNLPGIALLNSYGYKVKSTPILLGTGLSNALFAPFGGFSANLAAISAAICMNEEVDADKTQRYRATVWAGVFYLIAGAWASIIVTLFLTLPVPVTQMLAGFALLGTLMMCLQTMFSSPQNSGASHAALITFLIALSGISVLGVGAPIIGLLVGITVSQIAKLA